MEANAQITDHPERDEAKIDALKAEIIDEAKQGGARLRLPELPDEGCTNKLLCARMETPQEVYCKGYGVAIVNFAGSFFQIIHEQLFSWLSGKFVITRADATYRVQFADLFRALNRLQLDSERHIIVSLNVYLGTYQSIYGEIEGLDQKSYNGVGIYEVPSRFAQSIVVLRKEDMPRYAFSNIPMNPARTKGLKLLDESLGLYSDIDTLSSDHSALTVARAVQVYDRTPRYIRLNICYDTTQGKCDLHEVRSFDETMDILR